MSMNEFAIVIGKAVMAVFGVIAIVFIGSFLGAIPFKWCWNYIVPGLFGLREMAKQLGIEPMALHDAEHGYVDPTSVWDLPGWEFP